MATATSKNARRPGKTCPPKTERFLVVADLGPDADYTAEPRHVVESHLDQSVDYRRSPKQRRMLEQSLRRSLSGLPSKDTPLLMWRLDSKDRPVRLLNGSKSLSDKLLPMVSCEQKMHPTTILLQLYGEVTVDFDGEEWSDEQSELENEVLDIEFGDLTDAEMWTSDVYDDQLTVVGYGWMEVEVELPFVCSRQLSLTQVEYALDVAYHEATALAVWEPYSDIGIEPCSEAWLMEKGEEVLCLHSLRDLRLGKISRQKFQAICSSPDKHIPRVVLEPC